jgi:hypothetical protein
MSLRSVLRRRRFVPVLAIILALAAAGSLTIGRAASASATPLNVQQASSQNWAGYVVKRSTAANGFSSVSGSWVQPAATTGSSQGYSAFWVGLGGSSSQSQGLEQVGTEADVVNGQTQYSAWYELVPSAPVTLNLTIHAGDHIGAKVTVKGTNVTVSMTDQTTGASVTKSLHMANPDTSSAEWIAEAPSAATRFGGFQPLPLADFGKVAFTHTSATAGGHSGSIADPGWTVQRVQLSSSGGATGIGRRGAAFGPGVASGQSSPGATTSSLSSSGSFSVSWTPGSASSPAPTGPDAGGFPGGGYPGGGYGHGGFPGGGYGYGFGS